MKKYPFYIVMVICGIAHSAIAGDEYARCLDLNYQTNGGLIKCADDETERLMAELDKRYDIIAHHKFFRSWNGEAHSFDDLKQAWLKYRDDFCNLQGYSITHGGETYGDVTAARCRLSETIRFREELETLVKNYQKTLKK